MHTANNNITNADITKTNQPKTNLCILTIKKKTLGTIKGLLQQIMDKTFNLKPKESCKKNVTHTANKKMDMIILYV